MNIRPIILLFFFLVLHHEGYSCSCDYAGNFIKVSKDADLVALVRVKDHEDYFSLYPQIDTIERPMSVRVEIIKKYSGDEERKEVKIFGDNGYLCRESILHLNKGDYYIVAVHRSQNKTWDYGVTETEDDYQISSCGEFLLTYKPESKTVNGRIKGKAKKEKSVDLETFERIIKEN